jgi:hypothetical protein
MDVSTGRIDEMKALLEEGVNAKMLVGLTDEERAALEPLHPLERPQALRKVREQSVDDLSAAVEEAERQAKEFEGGR